MEIHTEDGKTFIIWKVLPRQETPFIGIGRTEMPEYPG